MTEPQDLDFLSGSSGQVSGVRLTSRAVVLDWLSDAIGAAIARRAGLTPASATWRRRSVLALAIERPGQGDLLEGAIAELRRSIHDVEVATAGVGHRGKFENLNDLLWEHPATGHDWLLVIDDDVKLPERFLDAFLFLAEKFDLRIAQPAHRHRSHAAWEITRRRPTSLGRETAFVEIGPVVAFAAPTFDALLPFPSLRVGWGLDAHWSALARDRGWKIGVIDATPIAHASRPIASSYDRRAAIEEARRFLNGRPYIRAVEAQRTIAAHRSWTQ